MRASQTDLRTRLERLNAAQRRTYHIDHDATGYSLRGGGEHALTPHIPLRDMVLFLDGAIFALTSPHR